MKFEASRVVQTVEQLADARFTGPGGLASALDFLAEGFHKIHWQTERREVRGLLIARPPANRSAAVRVVFLVPLGAVLPATLPDARVLLMIIFYTCMLFFLKAKGLPGWLFLVAAGLGLAAIWFKAIRGVRLIRSSLEPLAALSAAERSGPAFLLELARSWPVARSERLETICVAAGGQRLGHAGAREVLRMIKREWEDKPTLLVIVHGPGIGQEIVIGARRNRMLAATAALDLWIPHRTMTTNPFSALTFLWPFQDSFKDYVALFGGGCLGEKETRLDGGALDRTAQLCTEIALRWARQQRHKPVPPEQDRTVSRSFQNPG